MAGRILIADDLATGRIILQARLGLSSTGVCQIARRSDLKTQLMKHTVDVVLLSDPFDGIPALDLCREIRGWPGGAEAGLVVLSDRTPRAELLAARADAAMSAQPDEALLRARVRSLLRRRAAERDLAAADAAALGLGLNEPMGPVFAPPARIALVPGSAPEGLRWRRALETRMRDRLSVMTAEEALEAMESGFAPDAVVIGENVAHPGLSGPFLTDLVSHAASARAATLLVQAAPRADRAVHALDLGVGDVIEDGFDGDVVAAVLRRELARKMQADRRRAALADELRLAKIDPLTGLFNRRYALDHLGRIARAQGSGSFAVLVADLDRFKRINDSHGHVAGDAVLCAAADRMRAALRAGDMLARIGGEEFLAVLHPADRASAQAAAERLRRAVAETPIALPGDMPPVPVTVSIGLALAEGGTVTDPNTLIDSADRSLYAAKAGGRNQVTVAA